MRKIFSFISFARKIFCLRGSTHTDTHTLPKRAMPFSCLANHSSCTILLNGFSRPGYVCKNCGVQNKFTASQNTELNGAVTGRWCSTVTVRTTLFFSFTNQLFCLCFNWFSIVIKFYSKTPSHVYFLPESAIPLESRSASPINCELYFFWWLVAPEASSLIIRGNTADNWKVSDSMERQQLFLDSLKILRTKLVSSKHNSIPTQIIIVRCMGGSTGV